VVKEAQPFEAMAWNGGKLTNRPKVTTRLTLRTGTTPKQSIHPLAVLGEANSTE